MSYTFTTAKCESTPINFLENGRKIIKNALYLLCAHYNITANSFRINYNYVDRVSNRLYQRLNYYLFFHDKQLSQIRQAGLKAYWILRYHPITSVSSSARILKYDINVYLAFFLILCGVLGEHTEKIQSDTQRTVINNILKDYENHYVRSFSEYDISKESMMLIADSIEDRC